MAIMTFESGLKNSNKWITIQSGEVSLLRKASIASLLKEVYALDFISVDFSVCWNMDNGVKNGYRLTMLISPKEGEDFEVAPTTVYPFNKQRIFKTLDAAHNFVLSLGWGSFRVDLG